jgi:hypothetical protein
MNNGQSQPTLVDALHHIAIACLDPSYGFGMGPSTLLAYPDGKHVLTLNLVKFTKIQVAGPQAVRQLPINLFAEQINDRTPGGRQRLVRAISDQIENTLAPKPEPIASSDNTTPM